MPKTTSPKFIINLDLLRPQSNPEKIVTRLLRWLLSTGRYLFVFVEAVVLIAFIARFKLDADLASNKESIDRQIPYIDSLRGYEALIRQTQLKLSTVGSFYSGYIDYSQLLKKIADQTPQGIILNSINLNRNLDQGIVRLTGSAQSSSDLSTFVGGLRGDPTFSNISITNIGFEKGSISFSIEGEAKLLPGGKSL